MGIQIEDGKGSGILAEVTVENKLRTIAASGSLSSHVSADVQFDGGVFTVIGTATITGAGTFFPLFIQNTDPTFLMVLDRIVVEVVSTSGGTAIPSSGDFFSLLFLTTFTSGGTAVTPVLLNRTSTKVANGTFINNNPTLGVGSALESHRWYTQANGVAFELIRPETDDIILGRNNTAAIRYTTLTTAGTIFAKIKFLMCTLEDLP